MTTPEPTRVPRHRESHVALLHVLPAQHNRRPTIDAIVVPTARSTDNLQAVADLARATNCLLVVLCSIDSQKSAVADLVSRVPRLRALAIDLPAAYQHRLLRFSTSGHPQAGRAEHVDLSTKRNLGLLLARLLGWRQVLFVDDDIGGLDLRLLLRASAMLDRYRAVGFRITDFPDNSVVCHAHRLGGGRQQTFVGANALLMDVPATDSFFPAVYNEDWLFLFDAVRARAVATAGEAWQRRYDPFGCPVRAASEEFGDALAEGLLWLLHRGDEPAEQDWSFWRSWLECRSGFITEVGERLEARQGGAIEAERAIKALAEARAQLDGIQPGDCASFVGAWRKDLAGWRERLVALPSFQSRQDALRYLDLSASSIEVD